MPSFIKLSLFAALLIPCTYTYVIYDGTFPLCTANGPTYMISKYPKCIDKCKTSSHRTFHVLACHLHKTSFWKSQAEPPRKYITWLCWYKGHIDYIIFSYNIVVVPRPAYPKLSWDKPYLDTKSALDNVGIEEIEGYVPVLVSSVFSLSLLDQESWFILLDHFR